MGKNDKKKCVISHIGGNEYLLKGTPDQDAIETTVAEQHDPYIIVRVEGGNIRDLRGGIIPLSNGSGYLVFKRLFEASKRPAIYLMRDFASELLTRAKAGVDVDDDRIFIGGFELLFAPETRTGVKTPENARNYPASPNDPIGYVSLATGKKLLYIPFPAEVRELQPPEPVPAEQSHQSVTQESDEPAPPPVLTTSEPLQETASEKSSQNKILSIISAIASDERNLTLLKDIAMIAYSIIIKVKNSGAASKEEVATCVVAALLVPETRSRLRRTGTDIFRRFKELNKEAGSIVDISAGYRVTPDKEIILDEWPDEDMLTAIRAGMGSEIVKANINYDWLLGYPENLIRVDGADYVYIANSLMDLPVDSKFGSVYTVCQTYRNAKVIYAAQKEEFLAAIHAGTKIFHVSTALSSGDVFGCCKPIAENSLRALFFGEVIAECMTVCPEVYTVKKEAVENVLAALQSKVLRVLDPHPSDTKALIGGGYKIGTEKKGDGWLLWAFPAGKVLSVNGLPKAIAGGVPQY